MLPTVGPEDSAHPTNRGDAVPQTPSAQSVSAPPLSQVVAIPPVAGNSTAPMPNESQSNQSPAEQLSRAFVAQAAIINREGRSDFHLRLQPTQLGSMQIHLTATNHTISARVVVAQQGTQQLIESQAHQLRQALAESGLVLGHFEVRSDGGGSSQGGRHQPPELPLHPSFRTLSPTPTAVAKVSRIVAADGIDILA